MKKTPPNNTVEANYIKQKVLDYQGNPLIEALPPIFSEEDAIYEMSDYPPFYPEEKDLENQFRYHCIRRLKHYFQPLDLHKILEQKFSTLIREGYVGRNPLSKEYASFLQQNYQSIRNKKFDMDHLAVRSTATSFSIIGTSGTGKSTGIERVLAPYPQVIVHKNPINLSQLTWLKIECPTTGTLKGLCVNFFTEVDRVLKTTNFFEKFGVSSNSTEKMLAQMAQIAYRHCLGCLIIDEIQQLDRAKSGGAKNMMDFFQSLVNKVNVPIIFIGTKKALDILNQEFRIARRTSSQGVLPWKPLLNDAEWEFFIEGMWRYQWTKKETKLTKEFLDVLYEESQGIIDVVKNLFMMAQVRAIKSGKEEISIALIKSVAKNELKSLQTALQALKSGNPDKIMKFEDLGPIDFEDFLIRNTTNIVEQNKQPGQQKNSPRVQDRMQKEDLLEQVILELLKLDMNPKTAESIATQVMKKHDETQPLSFILREALKLALNSEPEVAATKDNPIKKDIKQSNLPESEDLTGIVLSGKEKGQSAYESLKEKGFIKPPLEEFPL